MNPFDESTLSGFLRSNALKLKIYINSAKDAQRLIPNYPTKDWNSSGWLGLIKYVENNQSKLEELHLEIFKKRICNDDPELRELLGITDNTIISKYTRRFNLSSPIYTGTKIDIILENDKELFKLLNELFSNFNTLILFIIEDNNGLPSNILFDLCDYGKVCNVAIYLDMFRHQSIARLVYILMRISQKVPGCDKIVKYIAKQYNIQYSEIMITRDDFAELYCPIEEDSRARMLLADQIQKSYKSVQSFEELKSLINENRKKREDLEKQLCQND